VRTSWRSARRSNTTSIACWSGGCAAGWRRAGPSSSPGACVRPARAAACHGRCMHVPGAHTPPLACPPHHRARVWRRTCRDLNISPQPIDNCKPNAIPLFMSRPDRQWLGELLGPTGPGVVDAFRHCHPHRCGRWRRAAVAWRCARRRCHGSSRVLCAKVRGAAPRGALQPRLTARLAAHACTQAGGLHVLEHSNRRATEQLRHAHRPHPGVRASTARLPRCRRGCRP
jgi:hypothetical protein